MWAHKIENSMIITLTVLDKQHVIVATMDGKLGCLEIPEIELAGESGRQLTFAFSG